jgi:transaldolase
VVKPCFGAESILESLMIEDVRRAADILRPVFDKSVGMDGLVSVEVDPRLARHTAPSRKGSRSITPSFSPMAATDRCSNVLSRPWASASGSPPESILRKVQQTGIDLDHVAQRLEDEGIQKFIDAFDKGLQAVETVLQKG